MSRFNGGDRVRIRAQQTLFHSRVPAYARGRTGVIERVLPEFVIPEDDTWGRLWRGCRRENLSRVQLHQVQTWSRYRGPPTPSRFLHVPGRCRSRRDQLVALAQSLIARDVIAEDSLASRMETVRSRLEPGQP
jgi:hypothetical protein